MKEDLFTKSGILQNAEVLKENYIPKGEELLHRNEQIKEVAGYLSYTLDKCAPPHILIIGPKGTGKTAIIKYLSKKLEEKLREIRLKNEVYIGYIIKPKTAFNSIINLCNSIGFRFPSRGIGFEEALTRWEEKTKNKISIMILDEIDTLPERDLNELLYHLSRRGKTTIIGITQLMTIMNKITDPSVQSSFMPRIVRTAPYDPDQLIDILKKRAELAFYPDSIEGGVISLCASLATQMGGDCRYGIQLLFHGTDRAIREGDKKLKKEHIINAQKDVEEIYIYEGIKDLKFPHKVLLWGLTYGKREINALFDWYNKNTNIFKLSKRRLSSYLSELESLGYLKREYKSLGRGRGVNWFARLLLDEKILKEQLKQDPFIIEIFGPS